MIQCEYPGAILRETAFSSAMLVGINGRAHRKIPFKIELLQFYNPSPPTLKLAIALTTIVPHRIFHPAIRDQRVFKLMVYSCGGELYYCLSNKSHAIYNNQPAHKNALLHRTFPPCTFLYQPTLLDWRV